MDKKSHKKTRKKFSPSSEEQVITVIQTDVLILLSGG